MIKERVRLEFPTTSKGVAELSNTMQYYEGLEFKVVYGDISAYSQKIVIEMEKPQ